MPDQLEDAPLVVRRFKLPVGQNDKDQPDSLADYEVAKLQNALVSSRGKRATRPGATLIANTPASVAVDGLAPFYPQGGTKQLLMDAGGKIYKYTAGAGTWTQIATGLSSGSRVKYVVGSGYALRLQGTDNAQSYDGTTVADEGNVDASCPLATDGIYHQNMFIIAGNLVNLSYFWWSTILTKTFARSTNAHKVGDKDNGAFKKLLNFSLTSNHGFLFFKDNSIYFIDSSEALPANWSKILIDDAHGLAASDSAVVIGAAGEGFGDVLFVSNDGSNDGNNKYRVRSLIRTINDKLQNSGVVSEAIQSTLDDINAAHIDKMCAIYFDNKYFLAFPSGSSTYNDTVAVLDLSTSRPEDGFWDWSVWSGWNVAFWSIFEISGVKGLYYGEASASTKVYQALSGTSDNGSAIEFIERGRAEDFGFPELDKKFEWVEPVFEQTDDSDVTIKAAIDGGDFTVLGVVNVGDNSPTLPVDLSFALVAPGKVRQKFPLDDLGPGRDVQIEIYHSELDKRVNFLGYTICAQPENIEMGDD